MYFVEAAGKKRRGKEGEETDIVNFYDKITCHLWISNGKTKSSPQISQIFAVGLCILVNTMKSSKFCIFWIDFAEVLAYNRMANG